VGRMNKMRGGKKKGKKKKRRGEKKREEKEKNEQFRHFTISIQQVKLFCQIFFKTAPTPSNKPLHQRSRSQSCFWRSRSPAKQTLSFQSYACLC